MTSLKSNKRSAWILPTYIVLLVGTFSWTYNYIFDSKIHFSGDNAAYYILGNAIASGEGFTNTGNINKTPHGHFPPGYPVLISGIVKIFSKNIITVKRANGGLFLMSILLVFFIANKLTDNIHLSFTAGLLFLLNHHFLKFSTIMMSEISFQFFVLGAILLFLYLDEDIPLFRNWKFFVLLLIVTFAVYIRTIGISVIGGLFLYFLLRKKWLYAMAALLIFVMLLLPWEIRNRNLGIKKNSYVTSLIMKNPYRMEEGLIGFTEWTERIGENARRYLLREIPNGIFSFRYIDYKQSNTALEWGWGFVLLGFIIFGLYRLKEKRLFFFLYFGCTMGILLNWSQLFFGPRFIFQLLPFLLILSLFAVHELSLCVFRKGKGLHRVSPFVGLVALIWIIPPVQQLHKETESVFSSGFHDYTEMAGWVKENVEKGAVISTRKPNLFHLYSERYVTSYTYTPDSEKLLANLKKNRVSHVVVDQLGFSSSTRYLIPAIQKYPAKFVQITAIGESPTYLFRYLPDIGYSGEFNEANKREGFGIFVWDNGLRFQGYWKNGTREGEGTLFLLNGDIIKGGWVNDKLEGKATFFDSQGVATRLFTFKNNKQINVEYLN